LFIQFQQKRTELLIRWYRASLGPEYSHPSQTSSTTGFNVEQLRLSNKRRYHNAKLPSCAVEPVGATWQIRLNYATATGGSLAGSGSWLMQHFQVWQSNTVF